MSVAPGFLHSIWANTQRREGMWHEVIDRVPLQGLIRPLSAITQVQYVGGIWFVRIIVTKMCAERDTAPHCGPSIIFISIFSPTNTQAAITASLLLSLCFLGLATSGLLFFGFFSPQAFICGFWYLHLTFVSQLVFILQPLAVKGKNVLPGWLANNST